MADAVTAEVLGQTALTEDGFLGGRLRLRQPASGHRAGTDAVLLAAAAPVTQGLILDVGAGVGSAALAFAVMHPAQSLGLVEKAPELAALARENLRLNAIDGKVYEADLFDPQSRRAAGLLDAAAAAVITNPPFLEAGAVRASPHAGKRAAHVLPEGVGLADWLAACFALLAPGGTLVMIHRPASIADSLAALRGRAGDIRLKFVHPRADKPAVRFLLRAKKASRAPLAIAPPLMLHEGTTFSPEAEALHRGAASLAW